MKNVYDKIKELRKSKGLTQTDVSEKIGLTQSNYQVFESGKTEITLSRLEKLSDIFGVSVLELLGGDNVPVIDNNELENLKKENEQLKKENELLKSNQVDKFLISSFVKITMFNRVAEHLGLLKKDKKPYTEEDKAKNYGYQNDDGEWVQGHAGFVTYVSEEDKNLVFDTLFDLPEIEILFNSSWGLIDDKDLLNEYANFYKRKYQKLNKEVNK